MKFILCLALDIFRVKKRFSPSCCVSSRKHFQLMKIINKDDSNYNDGSGSNNDDAKDNGNNYGNSYSNHHKIYDGKDDNDDDNSDNND